MHPLSSLERGWCLPRYWRFANELRGAVSRSLCHRVGCYICDASSHHSNINLLTERKRSGLELIEARRVPQVDQSINPRHVPSETLREFGLLYALVSDGLLYATRCAIER